MKSGRTPAGGSVPHNRRAFPRWKAEFEVRYGDPKQMREASGFEIGQEGVGFVTPDVPPLESQIEVAYRLGPSEEWTRVKAVVRHADGQKVGAEFLNIRRADRLRILDYITTRSAGPA